MGSVTPAPDLMLMMQLRTLRGRVHRNMTPDEIDTFGNDFDQLLGEWSGENAGAAASTLTASPEESPQDATEPQDGEDTVVISRQQLERIRRDREMNAWRARLNRNPHLQTNEKAMIAAIKELESIETERSPEGYLPVTRADLSNRLGITESAVSRWLAAVEEVGGGKRRYRTEYDEKTGARRDHLLWESSPLLLEAPDQLCKKTGGNTWGGARPRTCPNCQSTNLHKHVQIICHDCQTVIEEHEYEVNEEFKTSSAAEVPMNSPAFQDDTRSAQATHASEGDEIDDGGEQSTRVAKALPSFLRECPTCGEYTWIDKGFQCAKCNTVAPVPTETAPASAVPVPTVADEPAMEVYLFDVETGEEVAS